MSAISFNQPIAKIEVDYPKVESVPVSGVVGAGVAGTVGYKASRSFAQNRVAQSIAAGIGAGVGGKAGEHAVDAAASGGRVARGAVGVAAGAGGALTAQAAGFDQAWGAALGSRGSEAIPPLARLGGKILGGNEAIARRLPADVSQQFAKQAGGLGGALVGAKFGVKALALVAVPVGTVGAAALGGGILQAALPVTVRNRPLTPEERVVKQRKAAAESAAKERKAAAEERKAAAEAKVAGTTKDPKLRSALQVADVTKFLRDIDYDEDRDSAKYYLDVLADAVVDNGVDPSAFKQATSTLAGAGMHPNEAASVAYERLTSGD